ncbi:unnamed protein product [Acanthoscelides obtectus]|uniref:Secreted protein n=1 Tax=Acanthoscelides obtectus TaxID=200917 RepID=A0A9P0K3J8_ACAOB|nr:unnamed protein product [Acanthoscelides obtectus]CAK1665867.1 hypothetical protein AOBTE_LOCUS25013 [Acanthoscelides obtectus]
MSRLSNCVCVTFLFVVVGVASSDGPRMFSPLTRTGRGQAAWSSNDDKKNNNFVDLGNSSPYFSQDIEKVACTCRPVKDQQTTSNRESDEDQAALTQLK